MSRNDSWMYLDSLLINGPGVRDAIYFGRSLDVDIEHLVSLLIFYRLRRSFVNSHGVTRQSVLLLQLGVQQVDGWKAAQDAYDIS